MPSAETNKPGGRTATTTPEFSRRPLDRKSEIADNAGRLFSRHGFHAVRMDDIAAESGITARALYRHYRNKKALLSFVIRQDQDRVLKALREAHSRDASLDDVIEALTISALTTPHLGVLWQREARHLELEDLATTRSGTRELAHLVQAAIFRENPSVDPFKAEVRAYSTLSIVTSAGYYEARMPQRHLHRLIAAACQASVSTVTGPSHQNDAPRSAASDRPSHRVPTSRREQLINAAALALRRHGFGGTSIDDFGADISLVGPGIYRYFENKASVLLTVISRFHEWVTYETYRALAETADDDDVLRALVRAYIQVAAAALDLHAVTITESLELTNGPAEVMSRQRADHLAEWQRWLATARPDLSDRVVHALATAARTMVDDLARIPHLWGNPSFPDELTETTLSVLYDTVIEHMDAPSPAGESGVDAE
ncbi:TetR/AcrR family transcriptional regulator (plasmid) [Pseudonocardia bannensis]|uniref:Helix-turn-helix transcriptional regulator n=1 Tax=Pseudonocardia bannensis TaxID=630973 RepID=A0A848DIP7_9PSEU|nr:TetR/AcrR family transcriptional regulator [Pseudonocardia bannensis]NMH92445.1 helix-turn-helix transcriptional regulator [Pseudonocardia bannensis]